MYLKTLQKNKNIPIEIQKNNNLELFSLPYRSRVVNRCIITGRARSVYSQFRMNRNLFKKLIMEGKVNGFIAN